MKTIRSYWRAGVAAVLGTWALSAPAQSFTNDLVVYLSFDGNTAAQRGTTNEGTVAYGTARYIPGALGEAARFNNNGASGAVPSDWAVSLGSLEWMYSNSFSVSLWVRMFADIDAAILGNKQWNTEQAIGWSVTTRNGRNVQWATAALRQKVDLHPPLLQGAWHLVTLTFDRTQNRVITYLDGGAVQSKRLAFRAQDPLTPAASFPTRVGASGPGNYAGRADVDDLGMWPRVLTPAEVELIYTYGQHGTNLGLNISPPPVITRHPADVLAQAGTGAELTGAATGVGVHYEWRFQGVALPASDTPMLVLPNVQFADAGQYSFVAFNTGGACTSAVATLTVIDSIPPELACAADRTVECGADWALDPPSVADNAGTEGIRLAVVSRATNAVGCGATFATTWRWQATDASGNVSDPCSQTVTVLDTTPPTLRCAPDKSVECGQPWSFDPPAASDQCVFSVGVFVNSTNDLLTRFNPGTLEVGDEIILDGTARNARQFIFGYWGTNRTQADFAGNVRARVRFYANDGLPFNGYPTPGTVLYDSGEFPLIATPRATLIIDDFITDAAVPLRGPLPETFTWTIQFTGLGADDSAGVDLFSPPVVGHDYPDYWERRSPDGDWSLLENPAGPMDFAALLLATADPVTIGILGTVTTPLPGGRSAVTRTWVATDLCGNTSTCDQEVTLIDTTAPTVTCPPPVTLHCDQPVPPPSPDTVASVDCDPAPTVEHVRDLETGSNPRVITRTYAVTDGSGNRAECVQPITILASASVPPVITLQPQSRTLNVGATAVFTAVATSCEPPTYQWYFNGTPLPGQTAPSLTIPNLALADQGSYHVVAANGAGSLASQAAVLTVNLPPLAAPDLVVAQSGVETLIAAGSLLGNDSDPDGDPLELVAVMNPTQEGGTAVVLGGQVAYTPPPLFVGTDLFVYTIRDGRGGFATSVVDVLVDSSNLPAAGKLQIFHTVGDGYLLRFTAAAAGTHTVQRAARLGNPSLWQAIGTVSLALDQTGSFIDPNPLPGMAFYRIQQP